MFDVKTYKFIDDMLVISSLIWNYHSFSYFFAHLLSIVTLVIVGLCLMRNYRNNSVTPSQLFLAQFFSVKNEINIIYTDHVRTVSNSVQFN